jgi:hypothetical protein
MRSLVALCLLLAACASDEPPAVRACRSQANDDPEVRRLLAITAGTQSFAFAHNNELQDARQQAQLRCLRARGLAPPGGVEGPKRSYNLFDSLF